MRPGGQQEEHGRYEYGNDEDPCDHGSQILITHRYPSLSVRECHTSRCWSIDTTIDEPSPSFRTVTRILTSTLSNA